MYEAGFTSDKLCLLYYENKSARIAIKTNSKEDYREQLEKELTEINNQEMWQAGKVLRKLRPENL